MCANPVRIVSARPGSSVPGFAKALTTAIRATSALPSPVILGSFGMGSVVGFQVRLGEARGVNVQSVREIAQLLFPSFPFFRSIPEHLHVRSLLRVQSPVQALGEACLPWGAFSCLRVMPKRSLQPRDVPRRLVLRVSMHQLLEWRLLLRWCLASELL